MNLLKKSDDASNINEQKLLMSSDVGDITTNINEQAKNFDYGKSYWM